MVLLSVSACQEISIRVDISEPERNEKMSSSASPQAVTISDPPDINSHITQTVGIPLNQIETPVFTLPPSLGTEAPPTAAETQTPAFDAVSYLLDWDDLPQNVYLTGGHLKIFDTSYLYSPGTLMGTAYVREFFSHQEDLYFTEVIIHSPVAINIETLHSGFYGSQYTPVEEDWQLGDATLAALTNNQLGYRFSKGNIMVALDLHGTHPYVTFENLYHLAQEIEGRIPAQIPLKPDFPELPGEVNHTLFETYFRELRLVGCESEHLPTDTFVNGDAGFCFRSEIIELITDLKTGIYYPRFNKLLYVKEFQPAFQMGEVITDVLSPVRSFGWQHLPAGEYEAWFWIGDQLVAVLPFTFVP